MGLGPGGSGSQISTDAIKHGMLIHQNPGQTPALPPGAPGIEQPAAGGAARAHMARSIGAATARHLRALAARGAVAETGIGQLLFIGAAPELGICSLAALAHASGAQRAGRSPWGHISDLVNFQWIVFFCGDF